MSTDQSVPSGLDPKLKPLKGLSRMLAASGETAGEDRTAGYLVRFDAHADGLASDAERLLFAEKQLALWIERYSRFRRTSGASAPGATATDFVLTIGAVQQRVERYRALFEGEGAR